MTTRSCSTTSTRATPTSSRSPARPRTPRPRFITHSRSELGRSSSGQALTGRADRRERLFNDLRAGFEGKLDETLNEIGDATAALFDEDDGAVTRVLDEFRFEFEEFLGDAFDTDSKRSIIGRFDALVRGLRKDDREALREVLDPGHERSPLHRVQRDLTARPSGTRPRTSARLMSELSEKVAIPSAEDDLLDKTSIKGHSFEDVVHDIVSGLVAPYGDLAEQTGDTVGVAANRKGDAVVTLNEEDTRGAEAATSSRPRPAARASRPYSLSSTPAMENRDAEAAIAVFSSAENAPTSVPFFANGDKAIVVLDPEELDTTALRLATMWARWWSAASSPTTSASSTSTPSPSSSTRRARAEPARHDQGLSHRRRKKIDEAGRHVHELVAEIEDVLERLRAEIDGE